jgi:peroxiredoxin
MYLFISLISLISFFAEPTGLNVGDKAPAFTAVDQFGKTITLEESLAKGKVILTFYRGAWCRYCMKQFKAYQDSLSQITAKGATLIAITPEHEDGIQKSTDISKAEFSILHDDGLAIMEAYKVISPEKVKEYQEAYAETGEDNQQKYLPVPATYIIDQDGIVEYVYFDPNYKVRISVADLLAEL